MSGLNRARQSATFFSIDVPAGQTLDISISGGTGDPDLYVRKGIAPTLNNSDCISYIGGSSCSFAPAADTYFILLYSRYTIYSGVTLDIGLN